MSWYKLVTFILFISLLVSACYIFKFYIFNVFICIHFSSLASVEGCKPKFRATLVTRRGLEPKCVRQLFLGLLLVTRRSARLVWLAGHADREAICIGFGMPGMPIGKPVALGLACPACREWNWPEMMQNSCPKWLKSKKVLEILVTKPFPVIKIMMKVSCMYFGVRFQDSNTLNRNIHSATSTSLLKSRLKAFLVSWFSTCRFYLFCLLFVAFAAFCPFSLFCFAFYSKLYIYIST